MNGDLETLTKLVTDFNNAQLDINTGLFFSFFFFSSFACLGKADLVNDV